MRLGSGQLTWRGWAIESGGDARPVRSARLSPEAEIQNHLFPKMRSWFALGAPLELLSPLSVLRVLYPLAAVCWLGESVLLRWPMGSIAWVAGASAAACVVWLCLLFMKDVLPRHCHLLATLGTVLLMTSIWAGRGHPTALALVPLFVPLEAFVALFLGTRAVVWHQSLAVACLWLALVPTFGAGVAAGIAVVASLAVLSGSLIIRVLISSVWRSGTVDPDTGLPNGIGLAELIDESRIREGFVVASLLLAGVSEAREALGYRVGTELIRRATEDLGQVLPSEAVIARVDGDELVVAMDLRIERARGAGDGSEVEGDLDADFDHDPDQVALTAPRWAIDEGRELARVLADAIRTGRYLVGQVEVSLRAHVGLVFAPWDGTRVAELARRASLSARRAALSGQVSAEWDGSHGAMTMEDLSLLADLRLADKRGELRLAYQPQIDARSGRTVSVEALLRWTSPLHGQVPPSRFIVLAERTGLIDRLTEWVLREALDTQRRWRDVGLRIPVSVNLSAKMLSRPDLPEWILAELEARQLPTAALSLEVTETAAADLVEAVNLLRPLHDQGVRVSIDDFGTGYTSLAVLPYLPLDELKVDMGFVRRMARSPADEAIVRSVSDLAHRLGLTAVAEGVEDADICQRVTDIGYDLLQGYHFAMAISERGVLALMHREASSSVR